MLTRTLSTVLRALALAVLGWMVARTVAERRFQARLARPTPPWPDVPDDAGAPAGDGR